MALSNSDIAPFDRLRHDKTYGGYTKKLLHRRHEIEIRFQAESRDELEQLLPSALRFWRSRAGWFKLFREYATAELLSQLNVCLAWSERGPIVMTAARLRKLLTAPSLITFTDIENRPNNIHFEMTALHDALENHCINVFGTLEDGITGGEVQSLF